MRACALRARRRQSVKIEPAFDAVEPPIDVVEPLLDGGVIQFDTGDLALERAKPPHHPVELMFDSVETIVDSREPSAQKD